MSEGCVNIEDPGAGMSASSVIYQATDQCARSVASKDIHIRLNEDKEKWIKAAEKDGFKSLGTWIKWVVSNYLNKAK